jgi:hypothetical protein
MFHFNPFHIWDVILPIDELIFFKILHHQPDEYPIVLFDLQTKTGDFLQQTVSLPDGIPFYFPFHIWDVILPLHIFQDG